MLFLAGRKKTSGKQSKEIIDKLEPNRVPTYIGIQVGSPLHKSPYFIMVLVEFPLHQRSHSKHPLTSGFPLKSEGRIKSCGGQNLTHGLQFGDPFFKA